MSERVVLIVALVLIALVLPWWVQVNFFPYAPPTYAEEIADRRAEAFEACTNAINAKLKAPATAEFLRYSPGLVTVTTGENKETVFAVASYVDAQNSFGAKIRTKFICLLHQAPGASLRLVNTAVL